MVSSADRLITSSSRWCSSTFRSVWRSAPRAAASAAFASSPTRGRPVSPTFLICHIMSPALQQHVDAVEDLGQIAIDHILALDIAQHRAAVERGVHQREIAGDAERDRAAQSLRRVAQVDLLEHPFLDAVDDDLDLGGFDAERMQQLD